MATCLVLADVHANLSALQAVLQDAAYRSAISALLFLGDVVGYGAEPNECIERLRDYPSVAVAGNHDLGAVGRADLALFNADASVACGWTAARLSSTSASFLCTLPLSIEQPPFLLVHGSPANPTWEYVVSASRAHALQSVCRQPHCLVGHTHVPAAFNMESGRSVAAAVGDSLCLRHGRFLMNSGSVGQPRDGDCRAAYALLETDDLVLQWFRVSYDVDAAAAAIVRAGLPLSLAARLRVGY